MCGIVGYVGDRPCKELLLTGLERLEYRGYDSAGICLINGEVDITRRVGRVQELRDAVGSAAHPATTGLAHTRWATPVASPSRMRIRSRRARAPG